MTEGAASLLPLKREKADLLCRLVDGLDRDALLWLSGYLGGVATHSTECWAAEPPGAMPPTATAGTDVTIIYGSQTGHAQGIAANLANRLGAMAVRVVAADAYPNRDIWNERILLVVISTYGDGDPPDNARSWLDFLNGRRMRRLESLRYAVLALGDSSYPRFCHVGREVDARLAGLGAKRLLPVAEADVEFESVSEPWTINILQEIAKVRGQPAVAATPAAPATVPTVEAAPWTRSHPFAADLFVNQRISGRDSDRDVRHIELLIEGSGLRYQPGDSIGIWPNQDNVLVDEILDRAHLNGKEEVTAGSETLSLFCWLKQRRELTRLTRPFVIAHSQRSVSLELQKLLEQDDAHLAQMLSNWQLPDLLAHYPAQWQAADLVAALRPLAPRLYSIASSPLICDAEEVHLAIGVVDYMFEKQHRWGVASHDVARLRQGEHLPIFLEVNDRFRLPMDSERDIIMIGPGTGVAPFRAFVQHRAATGARGRNWLFFGNRHFRSEFFYQIEWQEALAKRQLHRLDLAFSRDGAGRVYVQQRMQEQAAELYRWIKDGAYVYVCGDAKSMARDVDAALTAIGQRQGCLSEDAAREWTRMLASEGRYLRDVY